MQTRVPIWRQKRFSVFPHWPSVRGHLHSHWFHIPCQVIVASFCVYWYWHIPAPNKAVLALTGVTIIMALLEMRTGHKAVYLLLVICLIFTENRAINKDRADSLKAEDDHRNEERGKFQSIADGLDATIANSDRQFAATMGKQNELLQNLTGGDSFAFVVPQTHAATSNGLPLAIHNRGKYMLTGVTVTVWGPHVFECVNPFDVVPFYVGTLNPGEIRTIGLSLKPLVDEKHDTDAYWIRIAAQNFTADQMLNIRKGKWALPWAYRYWVTKTTFRPNGTSTQKFLIKPTEWSDDLGDGKPTKH